MEVGKLKESAIGSYAFLAGVGLSVILSLIPEAGSAVWLIAILGIAVAWLNIQARETMKLLLWTIGMGVFGFAALASSMAGIPAVGTLLSSIITNIGLFFTTIAGVFLLKIGYKIFHK